MKPLIVLILLIMVTSVSSGQESAVDIAKRVIADKSTAFTPLTFEEFAMGVDNRDPRDAQLQDAASSCHDLIRTYMLGDNVPEKVRVAYAIRLLASKRIPTPVKTLGKLDAKQNEAYLKEGLALAARLKELEKDSFRKPAKGPDKYDLEIVDQNGNPISGATIEPISLSINYSKFAADDKGHAMIPRRAQPVKWVEVTKQGYHPSGQIEVDQPKPITVTLQKSGE